MVMVPLDVVSVRPGLQGPDYLSIDRRPPFRPASRLLSSGHIPAELRLRQVGLGCAGGEEDEDNSEKGEAFHASLVVAQLKSGICYAGIWPVFKDKSIPICFVGTDKYQVNNKACGCPFVCSGNEVFVVLKQNGLTILFS